MWITCPSFFPHAPSVAVISLFCSLFFFLCHLSPFGHFFSPLVFITWFALLDFERLLLASRFHYIHTHKGIVPLLFNCSPGKLHQLPSDYVQLPGAATTRYMRLYGMLHTLLYPLRKTQFCSGSPARVWVLARGWARVTSTFLHPMTATARAGRRSTASRVTRMMETHHPRTSTAFSLGWAVYANTPTQAIWQYVLWSLVRVFIPRQRWNYVCFLCIM